jgi:hypothetical protein
MYGSFEELYPVFSYYFRYIDVPESTRKGVPRGQPVPIGGIKFLVALLMILYPRGKKLQELAEIWGVSVGLISKWRTEDRFKKLIEDLEERFAVYVLGRMHEEDFLLRLLNSPHEPYNWSDRVLQVFTRNLGEAIKKSAGEKDHFYLLKEVVRHRRSPDEWWLNLPLPNNSVHKVDLVAPPKDSDMMVHWQDLLSAGLQSLSSYPWNKRGPKPEKRKKKDLIAEKFHLISAWLKEVEKTPHHDLLAYAVRRAQQELEELKEMLNVKN